MKANPYIYSRKLIQKSELKTFETIDSYEIMKKAAKNSFDYIVKNFQFQKILIICGPGNNGGDGILIAKHFSDKKKTVTIFAPLGIAKTPDSKKALNELKDNNLTIVHGFSTMILKTLLNEQDISYELILKNISKDSRYSIL